MVRPLVLSTVLVAHIAGLAFAQAPETEAPPKAPPANAIVDPYDTTAPVGALRSFIDAARRNDWAAAAAQLNLNGVDAADGEELARNLKVVLDRELWVDYDLVSDRRPGDLDDGLPGDLELIGTIDDADILLERLPATDGARHWKFSSGTVRRIPDLYDAHGYGPVEELLPQWMFDTHVLEMQLWQWIGLLVLIVSAWLLSWVVVRILHLLAQPLVRRSETDLDDKLLSIIDAPMRALIALGLFAVGALFLELSVKANGLLVNVLKALVVVGVTWLAMRVVDFIAELTRDRLERRGQHMAIAIVPLGRRVVKFALFAIALIGVLQNVGFQVTGLIAGLGVGGLAFALAAQKTIENLFGGVSLIADQPVRVGDYCRFGDKLGTIEEIGLRSTRIRTADRTRITVPNSQFSEIHLENFAARDRIRLVTVLGLRYETSPDQMRYVLTELRRVLISHPMVIESPARVRLVGFGASSLDVEISTYVTTVDWAEYLGIREDLYLRFMDVVAAAGTGFAFPSQTLYMAKDEPLDPEKTAAGERQVQAWRESGQLPFPDDTPSAVEQVRGSGDWPPAGSIGASTDRGRGAEEDD